MPPDEAADHAPRAADREDPRLRDRRRHGARGAVRRAPDRLRGLHRLRPGADVHRGLRSRRGAAALREHAHRVVRDRPADDATARGCAPLDPSRGRAAPTTTSSSSAGRAPPARSTSSCRSSACGSRPSSRTTTTSRDAIPADERPVVFVGPYEHHSNELPWRESIADVVTILEDADGRVDLAHLEQELAPVREPAAEDRQLLRRLERDRDRHRRRAGRDPAPPARRALVLGLRSCRPLPPDRHEPVAGDPGRAPRLQGRGVPLSAQVRRRPRHTGRARREALALPEPGPVGAGRRDDPLRQPDRALVPPRAVDPRGGRHARDRRVDPRRARVRAQGRGRHRRDPAAARTTSSVVRSRRGARTRRSRSSAIRSSTGWRSCRSACGMDAACCTRTSSSRSSTTCSGFRRAAAASAPGRTCIGCTRSTSVWSDRMDAEAVARPPGREARVRPGQLQLLHERGRLRLHRRSGPPARERGLEAAAALPLRSVHRSLAPRERPPSATVDAARRLVRLRARWSSTARARPSPRARSRATSRRRGGSSERSRPHRRREPVHDPPMTPSSSGSAGSRFPARRSPSCKPAAKRQGPHARVGRARLRPPSVVDRNWIGTSPDDRLPRPCRHSRASPRAPWR